LATSFASRENMGLGCSVAEKGTMHLSGRSMPRHWTVLFLILTLALLVRIFGLGWDLPPRNSGDEYLTVGRALNLLVRGGARYFLDGPEAEPMLRSFFKRGSVFNPHREGGYPPFFVYVQALSYKLYYLFGHIVGSFQSVKDLTVIQIFLVGRFVTAIFGLGTVGLVYLIGWRMFSRKVGLISALFLSFSFLHIRCSRIIKPDIAMVFFATLSFLFIYRIYERGKTWDYILAAIFLGFSVATKLITAMLILPLLLAHLLGGVERRKTVFQILLDAKLLVLLGFLIGGFFLATPIAVSRFSRFLGWFKGMYHYMKRGEPGRPRSSESSSLLFYFGVALRQGMGLSAYLCALGGTVYAFIRHRGGDILLLSFVLPFLLFMGSFTYHSHHYILASVPFLTVLAARLLVELTSRFSIVKKGQSFLVAGLAVGIILVPGMGTFRYLQLMTQDGTQASSKQWIEENIPRGSKIALEFYCPLLSIDDYKIHQSVSVGLNRLDWYRKKKFDYIVMSSSMYSRYTTTKAESLFHWKRSYETIEEGCQLIKRFDPPWFFLYNPNPLIKIYKIDYDHYYAKFPGDFDRYIQEITLDRLDRGWMLKSRILPGSLWVKGIKVKDPFVRLVDLGGSELVKLVVKKGNIGEGKKLLEPHEASVFLPSLPRKYSINIGYAYVYDSPDGKEPIGESYFKEVSLDPGEKFRLSPKSYRVEFIYRKMPGTHGAEYGQMVALFNSEKKSVLWSRIFGGELTSGDDYVVDPYVRITDSKGKEITRLLIHGGKVGSLRGSVPGPEENSVLLAPLPLRYKLYVGYRSYHDNRHRDRAGGPLEVELASLK